MPLSSTGWSWSLVCCSGSGGHSYLCSLPKSRFGSRTLTPQLLREAFDIKGTKGLNHATRASLGPRSRRSNPNADPQWSSTQRSPLLSGGCRFSWKPQSFWVTFSSPPTESASHLLFGMQGNWTPCELLSLSQSLVLLWESSDRIERFSCRHRVVSGLSGRNPGGRAQSLKPQWKSHSEKRLLGTHSREEKPLSPPSLNPALGCRGDGGCSLAELEFQGTASTRRLFPASFMKAAAFSLLPRGWHSRGWELTWKYPASAANPCLLWDSPGGRGSLALVTCVQRPTWFSGFSSLLPPQGVLNLHLLLS
ncbi:uncharacterized protein AAGF69_013449 [Amazona ochrocephala]